MKGIAMLTDVQKLLVKTLKENGCTINLRNGIWYIITPEEKVWTMTIPLPEGEPGPTENVTDYAG